MSSARSGQHTADAMDRPGSRKGKPIVIKAIGEGVSNTANSLKAHLQRAHRARDIELIVFYRRLQRHYNDRVKNSHPRPVVEDFDGALEVDVLLCSTLTDRVFLLGVRSGEYMRRGMRRAPYECNCCRKNEPVGTRAIHTLKYWAFYIRV